MRWFSVTPESLWQQQLGGMIGGWVLLFLRGAQGHQLPGGAAVGLAGRVVAVDRRAVRLAQMGAEYVVPLSDVHYIMKPGPTQQDELTLSAMQAASSPKGV